MRGLVSLSLLALFGITSAALAQAPQVFHFDRTHAVLDFTVRLVGFNRVRGTFESYRGDALVIADDPARSSVALSIDPGSIKTGSTERDDHLRGPDFFDAAKWPRMSFRSERVERAPDGGFVAVGPLTIRDVTREIRVPFTVTSGAGRDPFGNTRFAVAGKLTINRRDYGVVGPAFWNRAISDSVEIEFEMPGRRWNYATMSLGSAERPSAGRMLLDTLVTKPLEPVIADGWRLFERRGADSTLNFGWFEYLKAAGRLAEAGQTKEAAAVLDLGARVNETAGRQGGAANLRATLAELHLQAGDHAQATEQVKKATELDPENTAAVLIARHLAGQR
jgi:polyisoprenoid-binding protein YceI